MQVKLEPSSTLHPHFTSRKKQYFFNENLLEFDPSAKNVAE